MNNVREIIGCPYCNKALFLKSNVEADCYRCDMVFRKGKYVWDFIPKNIPYSHKWEAWRQLQSNGLSSYQNDPEHNLSMGEREDAKAFNRFCDCNGLTLDVGCGPQEWPAYFGDNATYVGVDPLAEDVSGKFTKIKALAEYLPFVDKVFDTVLFATSLDHFVDSLEALREGARVCKTQGQICVWFGVKIANQQRESPNWYKALIKPENSDDLFHVKRLTREDFRQLIDDASLDVVDTNIIQFSEYHINYFYRLRAEK